MMHEELKFAALIKTCTKKKDLYTGRKLHADIHKRCLLQRSPYLGNTLISMYIKCGLLAQAEQVHEELSLRNVITWNALISGYAHHGKSNEALNCLEQMQREGISPNVVTFTCILTACSKAGDIGSGEEIHEEIVSRGLLRKDIVLDNALVNLYAKCGMLEKAQQVLERILIRNVVTWASLIAGYAQQGQCDEALSCFNRMQNEGISPDAIVFTCIVKACGKSRDIKKGKQIHDDIINRGLLENDIMLGNALVDMYALCNMLEKAHEVLEKIPIRNAGSWNALIAGYAQSHGRGHEALHCFEQMQHEGIPPDEATFTCIMKACGMLGDIAKGKEIHDEIAYRGLLKKDAILGNALVDMYAKCGMLEKAQKILEQLCVRDVVSWSALIVGYTQQGQYHEALNCFEGMQNEGLSPDAISFTWILKACGRTESIEKGKQIHNEVMQRGLLEKDIRMANALMDMYAKCGMLLKAQEVLQGLPIRSAVSWSVLIAGYIQQGKCHEALKCFNQMQCDGVTPDAVTFICVLKACGNIGALDKGKEIHDNIVSWNLLEKDAALASALIDMYSKCGMLSKAEEALQELSIRNVASCSALISGYVQQEQSYEALAFHEQMQSEGILPDVVTYICVLKACGKIGAMDKGQRIHEQIISRSLLGKDAILGNALLDMYIKCGMLGKAQELLEKLPVRDEVSWSSLISGYAEQEQGHEALNCFEGMQNEGLLPNALTFISLLKACSITGCIDKGKQIHDEIFSRELLTKDIVLGTALVDMYAKCGMLIKAEQVFEELPVRNLVSWNALIAGFAQDGKGHEALRCFEQMKKEGLSPDGVTFLSVLTACCHSGLLDDAQVLFTNMTEIYGITPNLEHHTCMLLVYGCAGHFDKVMAVIKAMPSSDYSAVWITLLGACGKWGNLKLGKLAFDEAIQLDNSCAAPYILMASIFSDAGMPHEAGIIDAMRLKYAGSKNRISMCE